MQSWQTQTCPMSTKTCCPRIDMQKGFPANASPAPSSASSGAWTNLTTNWLPTPSSWRTIIKRTLTASSRIWGCPITPAYTSTPPPGSNSTMAPAGEDTLTAIVPVGHMSENGRPRLGRSPRAGQGRGFPPPEGPGDPRPRGAHQVRDHLHPPFLA